MDYPKRIIKVGETNAEVVKALKARLNEALGIGDDPKLRLDPNNSSFGAKMKRTVKLFQARHVDAEGRPLRQDGEVGSVTWSVLFGDSSVSESSATDDALLRRVLRLAAGEEAKAVREVPRNSNRGPEVDAYLRRAGVPPGYAWCCAFVYWCFDEAAKANACENPMVKTGGCLHHWNRALAQGAKRIPTRDALADPALVKPGMVFVMDHGGGLGHTGFVERVAGGLITTLEGNTDASRTREGGGVYRLKRKIAEINKGFIDYARG
ncbi:MAG: CHAP domain-containing protein [Pseudomonadota bacterium]